MFEGFEPFLYRPGLSSQTHAEEDNSTPTIKDPKKLDKSRKLFRELADRRIKQYVERKIESHKFKHNHISDHSYK